MKKGWVFFLIALMIIGFSSSAHALPLNNLLHYYSFDSENAQDEVKNNDGTIVNATFNSTGKLFGAYRFNENAYIEINKTARSILNQSQNWTITFWYSTDRPGTDNDAIISGRNSATANGVNIAIDDNNHVSFTAGNAAGDANTLILNTSTTDNNESWFFVTAIFYNNVTDPTQDYLQLYLNGVQYNNTDTPLNFAWGHNLNLTFGALGDKTGKFNGTLDEIGIWNISLTPTDVSDLYNGGTGLNPIGSKFRLKARDTNDLQFLSTFNITINGTLLLNTTNGTITTPILTNSTTPINLTWTRSAYSSFTLLNIIPNSTPGILTGNMTPINSTFNFTIYDETRNKIITWDNISVSIIAEDLFQANGTTENGTIQFPLVLPAEYRINYKSVNNSYFERNYFVNLQNTSFENINLYLLNKSYPDVVSSDGVAVTVKDTVNNPLEGAIVNVNKYFESNNTYITVERLKTNFDGETKSILTNDGFYRFVILYKNETRLSTQPSKIFDSILTFRIDLIGVATKDFRDFENIEVDLSFLNSSSTFTLTFSDPNNVASQVCLELWQEGYNGADSLLNTSCSSSQSGTILLGFSPKNSTTYTAKAYATIDSVKTLLTQLSNIFHGTQFNYGANGVWIVFILTALMLFMGVFNPVIALLLTPMPLLFASILGIINITIGVALAIYVAFIVIAIFVGSRS